MDPYQFYPTGAKTAARMWAKFKRPIVHVCDISAGKGHLIRHAVEGFPGVPDDDLPWLAGVEDDTIEPRNPAFFRRTSLKSMMRFRFDDIKEFSAVEIDLRHHGDLRELKAKIIGHDFLQVSSLATVTQVICNPPFHNAETHVLHAWEVLYDAEIVANVNANTIRNPYTQQRQRLVRLIEDHGTVEFLQDQFTDEVERTTNVEIALIYLEKVPARSLDMSQILHGLRADAGLLDELHAETKTGHALALPENFISNTYERFKLAVEAQRRACTEQAIAENLSAGLGLTLEEMQAKGVGNEVRLVPGDVRAAANALFNTRYSDLKRRAWAQIIRSSILTDKVSNQARKKLEATAASIYELDFSIANIHGLLLGLAQSMGEIYTSMVLDLFDAMVGRDTDNVVFYRSFKSNDKHRIGMRIRKSRIILPHIRWSKYSGLDYESKAFLADLDKVFGYLQGEQNAYDGIVQAIAKHDCEVSGAQRVSTRLFDFRYYKGAQTLHVYPKDAGVIDRLNRFVGTHRQWLPNDMQEANADFVRQYEQAESLSKAYTDALGKKTRFLSDLSPARNLLKVMERLTGDLEPGALRGLQMLSESIEQVHSELNIRCGPSLAAPVDPAGLLPQGTSIHQPMLLLPA